MFPVLFDLKSQRTLYKINFKNCMWMFLVLFFLPTFVQSISKIDHLEGEAGFRMASLHWKYLGQQKTPISFRVRYCELHTWGLHRCRYQVVETNSSRIGRRSKMDSGESNSIDIDIGGLRMATNYSFQVIPPQDPGLKTPHSSQIELQTKGFSAKATKCLANSSEVEVETGPFFGGRISVDESEKPGCFINGDSQSPQTKYILKIKHQECGSEINGSRVSTIVLVQENLPILTHSTRKFVVVCSFSPESFVVKTGVSLPRETSVAKGIDFSGIIRLSPQGTNLLIADKDATPPRRASRRDPSKTSSDPITETQSENSIQDDFDDSKKVPSSLDSRRQSRAYFHQDENGLPSPSAAIQHQQGHSHVKNGGWEGFLVLGLVSIGVIASLSSLLYFVKSFHRSSSQESISESSSVVSSDDGGGLSSMSSLDDSYGFPSRAPKNLDTRSELEVELDFEFSEERNSSIMNVKSNPSNFHLQLDKTWINDPPSSQA